MPDGEPALRDLNDPPVLGTLLAAGCSTGADYPLTGDKNLLALADNFPVVTPAQLSARHGSP